MGSSSPANTKRCIPQDFFSPISKRQGQTRTMTADKDARREPSIKPSKSRSSSFFSESKTAGTDSRGVPGLRIIPDFLTVEEEQKVLTYLNSQACSWRTDLSRRTMHFGGTYCLYSRPVKGQNSTPQILEAPPLPDDLDWLVDRMVGLGVYAEIDQKRPEYVIVNEYLSKMGISAHTENFSFHSPVVGLSLGSPDVMRFHELAGAFDGSVRTGKAAKAPKTGRVEDVLLPSRSLCIMSGESRWSWQHEIRPLKRAATFKRVSLTFRVKK